MGGMVGSNNSAAAAWAAAHPAYNVNPSGSIFSTPLDKQLMANATVQSNGLLSYNNAADAAILQQNVQTSSNSPVTDMNSSASPPQQPKGVLDVSSQPSSPFSGLNLASLFGGGDQNSGEGSGGLADVNPPIAVDSNIMAGPEDFLQSTIDWFSSVDWFTVGLWVLLALAVYWGFKTGAIQKYSKEIYVNVKAGMHKHFHGGK